MGSTSVHHFAKTKLGIKTYQNAPEFHTKSDLPSCIKPIIVQSVITECVNLIITGDIDTANGCPAIKLSFSTHPASQIRTCRYDKISVIRNIKTELYIDGQFQVELVDFYISIGIYDASVISF